jgi:hypothetical protein
LSHCLSHPFIMLFWLFFLKFKTQIILFTGHLDWL